MTRCNHCKENISPNAKVCPKCGEPDPSTKSSGCQFLIGLMLFLSFGCFSDPSLIGTGVFLVICAIVLYWLGKKMKRI